jgi:predicted acylesterase/phospholipase RssA
VIALPSDELVDGWKASSRPLEEAERALVQAVVSRPPWLPEPAENALRYAINLARLTIIRLPDGTDLDVAGFLAPFRDEVQPVATSLLAEPDEIDPVSVISLEPHLRSRALAWRARLLAAFEGRLDAETLDRECCEKALLLVCGGGGGVAWSYLGAFDLLQQFGLTPRLIAGTSMGAAMALFRAQALRWHPEEMAGVVKGLSFRTLFRFLHTESRYGLPAAMRLYLRAAVIDHLRGPGGEPPTLGQLPIPLVVACAGLRTGALPREPEYYEHLLDPHEGEPLEPLSTRLPSDLLKVVGELMAQRDRFARLYLGADEGTSEFDAIDAVGFSSALPGVIHYDVLREDPRMHALLEAIFQRRDLFRLVDGGLVDNLPARPVWGLAQAGAIGTRNTFVLGLEGFGPKLSQPLWYGLEQIAAQTVARSRPFVSLLRSYQRVLSPLEVVPGEAALKRAVQAGRTELLPDMPLVARLCRPYPAPA